MEEGSPEERERQKKVGKMRRGKEMASDMLQRIELQCTCTTTH